MDEQDSSKRKRGIRITMQEAIEVARDNAKSFLEALETDRDAEVARFRAHHTCPHCGQCPWDDDIAETIPKFIWLYAPSEMHEENFWSVNHLKIEFENLPDNADESRVIRAAFVSFDGGSEKITLSAWGETMHDALRSLRSKIEKCPDPEWVKQGSKLAEKSYRALFRYHAGTDDYSTPLE